MSKNWILVQEIILKVLKGKLSLKEAQKILAVSDRTIRRYLNKTLESGTESLREKRGGNNRKLTPAQICQIKKKKQEGSWRSSRWIKENLNLQVHPVTIWRILGNLNHLNYEQAKPITRFEAKSANELWQTDIMGRIFFPKIGCYLYLIVTIDDYARFCLSDNWYQRQSKINVFSCWYQALSHWGLPEGMLQDKGSQYRPTGKIGEADYQYYARLLNIKLVFAHKAQTKGKIERFWGFVQDDFVPSVWKAKTEEEINSKFRVWLAAYNWRFRSEYFDGKTRAERYRKSQRRIKRVELETLLLIEERRKVTRESTISLYGKHYFVPPGYIGCRIWVKIMGNQVLFEANGQVFYRTKLRLS